MSNFHWLQWILVPSVSVNLLMLGLEFKGYDIDVVYVHARLKNNTYNFLHVLLSNVDNNHNNEWYYSTTHVLAVCSSFVLIMNVSKHVGEIHEFV